MKRILFISLLSLFYLTSCTTLPQKTVPKNEEISWENRQTHLLTVQSWNLKGAIAIRTPNDAWSASLQWKQTGKNFQIALFGPLGTHSLKLIGNPESVQLQTADGKTATAASPEDLLQKELGWRLPVSNLFYWVRGLPAPGIDAKKQYDHFHHLTQLTQADWDIQFLRYTSADNIDVPSKIFLQNAALKVKIIISQWDIG